MMGFLSKMGLLKMLQLLYDPQVKFLLIVWSNGILKLYYFIEKDYPLLFPT